MQIIRSSSSSSSSSSSRSSSRNNNKAAGVRRDAGRGSRARARPPRGAAWAGGEPAGPGARASCRAGLGSRGTRGVPRKGL